MTETLLITNCTLLPLSPPTPQKIIAPAYILARDGLIAGLGPLDHLPPDTGTAMHLDAAGKLVLPGLINGHCHAPMTLFRGLADDLPLQAWLHDHIFPAEAANVNPEMVYWCTRLAAAEMLLSGTTCVADGYFLEHQVAQAFAEAGIRAVAAQGIIDFPAPGVPDPTKNILAAERFILDWQQRDPLITPAVFCHSPYTCSAETIRRAKAMARQHQALFFIHTAETRGEVEQCRNQHQLTPVRYLEGLDVLDRDTVLIHAVWLDEPDLDCIEQAGAKIVTCPESNMKLASGVAPLPGMLDRGIMLGLGTDGCASNNNLDLFQEMDSCAKLHKAVNLDPTVLPAGTVLDIATRGGAAVLNLDGVTGCLAPGMAADLILLDIQQPHLQPFYNSGLLVYGARGSDVTDVVVNGRQVVRNRQLTTIDLDETMARVRKLAMAMNAP